TGLIGTYVVLRNGSPTSAAPWPMPRQVHLVEWIGALNTFVLICSSLTVVLAHYALVKGQTGQATTYVLITFALGGVFLVIKAVEYKPKWDHKILPGRVFDHRLDGPRGTEYVKKVSGELRENIEKNGPYASECKVLLEQTEQSDVRRGLHAHTLGEEVNK